MSVPRVDECLGVRVIMQSGRLFSWFLINNVRIYNSGVVLYMRQIYVRNSGVSD